MRKAPIGIAMGLVVTAISANAADEPVAESPEALICKYEKKVNSRFTSKTCFTKAQWAERAERDKRDYAENQSRHKIFVPRDN